MEVKMENPVVDQLPEAHSLPDSSPDLLVGELQSSEEKTEKEVLELTLKCQQVVAERDAVGAERDAVSAERDAVVAERDAVAAERDAAIADRAKHDSQCRESQRQNKMLMLKQKTLELQIADLKTEQHEEKLLQQHKEKLRLLSTVDGENFQQFQDALVRTNNDLIGQTGTSKKKLKGENDILKSKSEKSDITLMKLDEEREHLKKQLKKTEKQLEKTEKQLETLESLCRSLLAERKQNFTGGASNTDSVAV